MRLLACECFIEFSRHESFALYKSQIVVLGCVQVFTVVLDQMLAFS